jgi:hypothetical protein
MRRLSAPVVLAPSRPSLPNAVTAQITPADCRVDLALARELDRFWTGWIPDRGARALARPLPEPLRGRAAERLARVAAALAPAGDTEGAALAVSRMLAGYSSARATGADAAAIVAQYVSVLSDLPLWAIERTCEAFARGRIAGQHRAFAPSSPLLWQKTHDLHVAALLDEREAITAALEARPEPAAAPRPSREEIEAKLGRKVG